MRDSPAWTEARQKSVRAYAANLAEGEKAGDIDVLRTVRRRAYDAFATPVERGFPDLPLEVGTGVQGRHIVETLHNEM